MSLACSCEASSRSGGARWRSVWSPCSSELVKERFLDGSAKRAIRRCRRARLGSNACSYEGDVDRRIHALMDCIELTRDEQLEVIDGLARHCRANAEGMRYARYETAGVSLEAASSRARTATSFRSA